MFFSFMSQYAHYHIHDLGVLMHTRLLTKARMLNLQRKPVAIKKSPEENSLCIQLPIGGNCVTSSGFIPSLSSGEVHSFNCSAVWLLYKKRDGALYCVHRGRRFLSTATLSSFLSRRHISFILWKSRAYTDKNNSTERLCENTSCSSHAACLFMQPKLLSNSLSCNLLHQQWNQKEFPSLIFLRRKPQGPHMFCSSLLFCYTRERAFWLVSKKTCKYYHYIIIWQIISLHESNSVTVFYKSWKDVLLRE